MLTSPQTLHLKLKELEQDGTDLKSLNAVHKQLIDRIILHHKDRGVKAYAACCLADLLRLYAPDAPYTGDELRDIFQFFVVQITQNLKYQPGTRPLAPSKKNNDASSQPSQAARINEIPYYNEYSYLLDNLASIKSVILICELPSADDLITTYFDSFADIVRPDMKKLMVRNMASILADLLNEADTVPTGVMDCIFGQFENYGTVSSKVCVQELTCRRQNGHRSSSSPMCATVPRSSCSARRLRTSPRSSCRTAVIRVRVTSRFSRRPTSSSSPSSAMPRTCSSTRSRYSKRTSRLPRKCPFVSCRREHSVQCSERGR